MDSGSEDGPQPTIARLLERLCRTQAEAERAQADTHQLLERLRQAEALIKQQQSQLPRVEPGEREQATVAKPNVVRLLNSLPKYRLPLIEPSPGSDSGAVWQRFPVATSCAVQRFQGRQHLSWFPNVPGRWRSKQAAKRGIQCCAPLGASSS